MFAQEKLHTQSPKSLTATRLRSSGVDPWAFLSVQCSHASEEALLKESQKGGQRVLVADESRSQHSVPLHTSPHISTLPLTVLRLSERVQLAQDITAANGQS